VKGNEKNARRASTRETVKEGARFCKKCLRKRQEGECKCARNVPGEKVKERNVPLYEGECEAKGPRKRVRKEVD
jgi:hypothetical protein